MSCFEIKLPKRPTLFVFIVEISKWLKIRESVLSKGAAIAVRDYAQDVSGEPRIDAGTRLSVGSVPDVIPKNR